MRILGSTTLLIALACAVVACGGDDDGDGQEARADVSTNQERVDRFYKGTYTEPVGPSIKPEENKNIWFVSAGQGLEASVTESQAVKEAGEALGWDVTIYDGKFNPNRYLDGVEQALSAKADGIMLLYVDCPPIKTALQRAEKQDVAVVGIEASDCNELKKGDEKLFDWVVQYQGNQPFREWIVDYSALQADWVIAQTDGQANVVLPVEFDTEVARLQSNAYKRQLDRCEGCEYTEVQYVASDYGPALQQKIEQALIETPNADSFISIVDAVLTTGGAQALRASGRVDEMSVMSAEGSTAGIELIHDGVADACVGFPTEWEAYAAADALARLFADKDPGEADSGMGLQICDREHNLPPKGKAYQPPLDFRAAYRRMWGID